MLSNEVINKLYKELELQLDNKQFFNAKDYYNTTSKKITNTHTKDLKNNSIAYIKTDTIDNYSDYTSTVKGIAFSNKIEDTKKTKSVSDLSLADRKIYKIADLLSQNLEETIIIPYNVMPTSLALVKKFDWKDVLFSDIGTAWGMVKSKLKIN